MTPPLDWSQMVFDLARTGMSMEQIADRIGRSKTQVLAYKNIPDTEPPFAVGLALLALWQERCVIDRVASAPTLR